MVEAFEIHGHRIVYVTAEFVDFGGRVLPVEAWAYRIEDGVLIENGVAHYVKAADGSISEALDLAAEILRWVRELAALPAA